MSFPDRLVARTHFAYHRNMDTKPNIAEIGALVGDPARAGILTALSVGQALTATELSYEAGVTPQTASSHLAKLADGGLITVAKQGRHRYYRLAGPEVAQLLETIMGIAVDRPARPRVRTRIAEQMRAARTCYDHFAGLLGVGLTNGMLDRGYLVANDPEFDLTPLGEDCLVRFGVDVDRARRQRRAFARQCVDWSERTPHLAGALGAGIVARCFDAGYVRRGRNARTIVVTEKGRAAFGDNFGYTGISAPQ